jgi:NAD(P)-dependent dehydrogenase (short-subunit alcohol dehydrogenase family)
VWPHLRTVKGSIVNIAGIGSRAGSAEFTIGGSVNVALLNFTKAMADIDIQQGVRVNATNPGLIATDRCTRNVERVMRERGFTRDEAPTFLVSSHGTTHVGRPEEIGAMVACLASSKADFVQGAPSSMSMVGQLDRCRGSILWGDSGRRPESPCQCRLLVLRPASLSTE